MNHALNLSFGNIKDIRLCENESEIAINIKKHQPKIEVSVLDVGGGRSYIRSTVVCGNTVINGCTHKKSHDSIDLIKVDGFNQELIEINQKGFFANKEYQYMAFAVSKDQPMERYFQYLDQLITEIEQTYDVQFPSTIDVISDSAFDY